MNYDSESDSKYRSFLTMTPRLLLPSMIILTAVIKFASHQSQPSTESHLPYMNAEFVPKGRYWAEGIFSSTEPMIFRSEKKEYSLCSFSQKTYHVYEIYNPFSSDPDSRGWTKVVKTIAEIPPLLGYTSPHLVLKYDDFPINPGLEFIMDNQEILEEVYEYDTFVSDAYEDLEAADEYKNDIDTYFRSMSNRFINTLYPNWDLQKILDVYRPVSGDRYHNYFKTVYWGIPCDTFKLTVIGPWDGITFTNESLYLSESYKDYTYISFEDLFWLYLQELKLLIIGVIQLLTVLNS